MYSMYGKSLPAFQTNVATVLGKCSVEVSGMVVGRGPK
jgi:hypothetical protein